MSREVLQWNKTLYLAGKAKGRKWDIVSNLPHEWVATDQEQHPEEYFDFKQDPNNHGLDREFGDRELAEKIKEGIVQTIHRCEGLVAYLDEPDSYGSIAEITVASMMGLKILMLIRACGHGDECCGSYGEDGIFRFCEECWRLDSYWDAMRDAYLAISCFPGVSPHRVQIDELARELIASTFPPNRYPTYEEYLASPEWKAKREKALARHGHACALCGSKKWLQVHHKTYERVGNELDQDLIPLCRSCHSRHHGKAVFS